VAADPRDFIVDGAPVSERLFAIGSIRAESRVVLRLLCSRCRGVQRSGEQKSSKH
jgi:hypothetical protein